MTQTVLSDMRLWETEFPDHREEENAWLKASSV